MALQIGQKLYGYCGGYFDNAHVNNFFRVEAVGIDWVVVRGEDDDYGKPDFASGIDVLEFLQSKECTQPKIFED